MKEENFSILGRKNLRLYQLSDPDFFGINFRKICSLDALMEKSTLITLIRSLSPIETREVRKFLNSPFFNQRQDVMLLFEHLVDGGETTKESAWVSIFGKDQLLEEQKLRLLMSYLHTLLEQYLAVKETLSNNLGAHLQLATAYRKRKLLPAFERTRKNLFKALQAQTLRNADYHEQCYHLDWETHQDRKSVV